MEALSATASDVLRQVLAAQPNTAAKVACAWQIAAGRALARAGRAEWRQDGGLVVRASGEAWRRELRRLRPLLQRRLTELLGPGVITQLLIE